MRGMSWWLAVAGLVFVAAGACTGDEPVELVDDGGGSSDATTSSSGAPGTSSSSSGGSSGTGTSSSGGSSGAVEEPDGGDAGDQGLGAIAGLALWLEGDGLTAGPLTAWPDRSPRNHVVTAAADRPKPVVSNLADGIGGHPAVHLESLAHLVVTDSASLRFDGAGYLVAIVERHHAATSASPIPGVLVDKASNGAPFSGLNFWLQHEDAAGYPAFVFAQTKNGSSVRSTATMAPGAHLVAMRLKGTVLSVTVDNGAEASADVGPLDPQFGQEGLDLTIGNSNGFPAPFTGDIAAVVMVKAPSDADVLRVSSYLRQRYGF